MKKRLLVGCARSGIMAEAFEKQGWDVWECDLLPGKYKNHIQDNVLNHLEDGWDMAIFHPTCTFIAVSGNRWYAGTQQRKDSIAFVEKLWLAPIKKIAIENPIGQLSTQSILGKPTQIIQPYQFGHGETKATCLWLKELPLLKPTKIVEGRQHRIWKMPPSKERGWLRSITYSGIADAMAEQWGNLTQELSISPFPSLIAQSR